MSKFWDKEQERDFFVKSLEFAKPEQLFYFTNEEKYLAYWPKNYDGIKSTLQSRNSLIGSYTEKWISDLFTEIAESVGGYSIQKVICEEISLTRQSPADVAICKKKSIIQKPEDILMLLEIKMCVVWNWEFNPKSKIEFELSCIGDYRTHQGNPSLLRSDSMLKAIGKSINIRVSGFEAAKIPIVIIGNTPITKSYYEKVDHLKRSGIIQGFWSLNPIPLDSNEENIKDTPLKGFYRLDSYEELKQKSYELLREKREFFSSMQSKARLGEIIEIANKEINYELKAQKFLELIREVKQ